MKAVADTLGVARSQLAERLSRPAQPRGPYRKPEDARLLPTIRAIVDARPSYGYRRVTALVGLASRKWRALFLKEEGSDGRPEADLYPRVSC
ncbi:hypothetical protein FOHLNKBM_6324 [Methylobacterium longum]|nr:hypothetical protein FOHLNKBM_6324 [Methylobacterium longum]